jgi:prevent-host-death family protein
VNTLSAAKARSEFSRLLERTARRKERVTITRRGKEMAALVPMRDLRLLEQKIEEEEDRIDRQEVRKAKAEGGVVPYESVRQELGLA